MNSTALTAIELYPLQVPLQEPFTISLGTIHSVQNVVVILRTEDGCAGYGECSPFMSINGESMDTALVVGRYFAQVLQGHDALDIEGALLKMDRTIYGNTSIKSAFDIALHDIAAQHAGLPLYQFLGGRKDKTLHTDMTVSINDPAKMRADAERFKAEGFPAIKVKLGGHPEEDVARIRAIREGIGPDIPLRIDANQGWPDVATALSVLQALAPYGIEHCEEPIPRWRFMELAQLSARSPIPIMADESCGDHHDAERLIGLKACPMFNIKLGKAGGLRRGLRIAELAGAAGMELQVGGFMESRLGMTASAHLALAHPAIHHCDFDTPLMFTEDPIIGGIQYGAGGTIEVPDTPGLGAVVEDRWLEGVRHSAPIRAL